MRPVHKEPVKGAILPQSSRFAGLNRHTGMSRSRHSSWPWLSAVVIAHLVVSFVHGSAHQQAHVDLSPAATAFVFVVILAGPLAGLGLMGPAEQLGGWVVPPRWPRRWCSASSTIS